jgi:hypothetical protein
VAALANWSDGDASAVLLSLLQQVLQCEGGQLMCECCPMVHAPRRVQAATASDAVHDLSNVQPKAPCTVGSCVQRCWAMSCGCSSLTRTTSRACTRCTMHCCRNAINTSSSRLRRQSSKQHRHGGCCHRSSSGWWSSAPCRGSSIGTSTRRRLGSCCTTSSSRSSSRSRGRPARPRPPARRSRPCTTRAAGGAGAAQGST